MRFIKKIFFSITDFKESFRFELSCLWYMYMGTHTHTHASPTTRSILSLTCFEIFPPLPSISKISAFVQTYLVEPRPHCLPLKKSEINNLVPSPLWLLQTNYQLSTNMPSEKQINKQTKKLKPWSHHFGGSNKSFYLQRPRAGEIFFFFKMSKDTLLPGNREEARSPWDTGPLPLPPWRKEKAALIARVYFFTAVFRGRPLAICTLKIYTWQLPTLLLYI